MATLSIYRGLIVNKIVNIDDKTLLIQSILGDDIVKAVFTLSTNYDFFINDWISFKGNNYYINTAPEVKKVSANEYIHTLTFEGERYKFLNVELLNEGEAEFFYMADADKALEKIIDNLNRVYGVSFYSKGTAPATEDYNFQFTDENCLAALQKVCSQFSIEFEIVGTTINLLETVGNATALSFEYKNGLSNIKRSKVDDKNIVTRVYAFGSTKNIDYTYRDGAKRLTLDDYIENNVAAYGIREGIYKNDEIYPRFNGAITTVNSTLSFSDASIDFDINDSLIEGVAAKVIFRTGYLAGYRFEIVSYVHSTKTITLKSYKDDTGKVLPSDPVLFDVGDEYTLIDLDMPAAYITAAEAELSSASTEWLLTNSVPRYIYNIETDWHILKTALVSISVGDIIEISDADLGVNVQARVLSLQQSLANIYDYKITLGEEITVNVFARAIGDINSLKKTIDTVEKRNYQEYFNSYRNTLELQDKIYDAEGYFDTDNIKPFSIETSMLSVGSKGAQLTLSGVVFEPNYLSDANNLQISAGNLIHLTIDTSAKTFAMSPGSFSALTPANPYYIFARLTKTGSSGIWDVTTVQRPFEDATYYYVLIGLLHSVSGTTRAISLTYGQTTVNGGFIKTGKIQSQDGNSYIDLDNNVIVMASGSAGGFSVSSDRLSFVDGNKELILSNTEITSTGKGGRGLTSYTSLGGLSVGDVAIVSIGQVRTKNAQQTFPSTAEYGFEIIKYITGPAMRHLVRFAGSEAMIAGWNIDYDAIYSGTKKTSDGYSTSGITLASNGSIHALNFYLNSDGSVAVKNITIQTANSGAGFLSIQNREIGIFDYANYSELWLSLYSGFSSGIASTRVTVIGNGKGTRVVEIGQIDTEDRLNGFFRLNGRLELDALSVTTGQTVNERAVNYIYVSSGGTLYLPASPQNKRQLVIKNGTSSTFTISGNGRVICTHSLYDATSFNLSAYDAMTFYYYNARWWTLGRAN